MRYRAEGIRRGELKDNLPQLLAAFYIARETGELGLMKGQVKKIIYFEGGMPVFALSNLVADVMYGWLDPRIRYS